MLRSSRCRVLVVQTTTSDKDTWYWTDDPILYAISLLKIDMLINKFEYTTIQEVDPVDMWAILGASCDPWDATHRPRLLTYNLSTERM